MNTNDRIEEMFIFVGYTTYVKQKMIFTQSIFILNQTGKALKRFKERKNFFYTLML
jgi:hypothetical protein